MDRRDTLRTVGGIGIASLFGAGATGAASAGGQDADGGNNEGDDQNANGGNNEGQVGKYNGNKTLVPPDLAGFDKVLLYIADGNPNPDWDGVANAERFQQEIMGRDVDEIVEDKQAAVDFYDERFGLDFPDANEQDLFTSVSSQGDVDATLNPLMLDPDVGYTAYAMSGRGMPNNYGHGTTNTDTNSTGKVRDGGWIANIHEDATLGGTYGDEGPSDVKEGALLAFGDYNIRMGDKEDPVVIHYESEHPIPMPGRIPVAFNCDLFHEEWGEGQVHGTMGGTLAPGIRNVLTFPPSLKDC